MAGARTIGIDVGGTKVLALAVDGDGTVEHEHRVRTPQGADAIVAALAAAVAELVAPGPVGAVGRFGREAAEAGRAVRIVELAGGDFHDVRGEHVAAASREGDAEATALMAQFGWWVGRGLANLADAFDPTTIVVGGGLLESADLFLDHARAAFADLVLAGAHRPPVAIVPAALGE